MTENRKTILIPENFHQRVAAGIYDPMYWIRVGLPIPKGRPNQEISEALHATFQHDLLDHHRIYTKRESLREEPSTLTGLAVEAYRKIYPTRAKSKRSTETAPVPTEPKPEFAQWAVNMLGAAETEVVAKGKCQNATAYQCEVAGVFGSKLDAFRKAEKLASLPKNATIEDKIDAGYYEQEGGLALFKMDVLASAVHEAADRTLQKIYEKAYDTQIENGLSAVLVEFRELLEILK